MIAVGGCYAEAQRERLFELYPYVDVAFGPGSIPHLGEWLGAGGEGVSRGRFGLEQRSFASLLPMHRERRFQAWVRVSMGCNSKCACIVPSVRGREQSRRPGEVIAEVEGSPAPASEITLLSQNVNSYGRDLLPDIRTDFGAAPRLRRRRRHRADPVHEPAPEGLSRAVIAAMAECDAVCEHAPAAPVRLTRILKAMRRMQPRALPPAGRRDACRHTGNRALDRPDRRLPGETEEDFLETVAAVEEIGFDSAFTFVFSPRATEAATMGDQVPEDVKRDRIERLIEVVQQVAHERNQARIGRTEEVLVEGPSRTDPTLLRGRTHDATRP